MIRSLGWPLPMTFGQPGCTVHLGPRSAEGVVGLYLVMFGVLYRTEHCTLVVFVGGSGGTCWLLDTDTEPDDNGQFLDRLTPIVSSLTSKCIPLFLFSSHTQDSSRSYLQLSVWGLLSGFVPGGAEGNMQCLGWNSGLSACNYWLWVRHWARRDHQALNMLIWAAQVLCPEGGVCGCLEDPLRPW